MRAKKSLGQHFLNSREIISQIVKAGNVTEKDLVLEIGPGKGTLTLGLLQTGASVLAVEKDEVLIPELQNRFAKEIASGQLNLFYGDILNFSSGRIFKNPYKIVANIPYYITGQIIRTFLEKENQPEQMTILVQKEVAERIVAKDKKESLLSLSVKIFGNPKIVRTVGRGAFVPPPKVDSAVLNIEKISRSRLKGIDEKVFFDTLHAGFAHKRKQLLPNLSKLHEKTKLAEVFKKLNVDLKVRAEDLSLETWIKLVKMLG